MLIIGQPKSASTSLLKTLAAMFKMKFQNGISKNANYSKDCPGFKTIQSYHGTMAQRDLRFFQYWINKADIIYKEHILPVPAHIQAINQINKPILILLRDPDHSFDNYIRLRADYMVGKLTEKENSILRAQVFVDMDMKALRRDLCDFNQGWTDAKIKSALYIDYSDLVLRYQKTMEKICLHFRILAKIIPLMRAMGNRDLYCTYTGVGERRLKGEN